MNDSFMAPDAMNESFMASRRRLSTSDCPPARAGPAGFSITFGTRRNVRSATTDSTTITAALPSMLVRIPPTKDCSAARRTALATGSGRPAATAAVALNDSWTWAARAGGTPAGRVSSAWYTADSTLPTTAMPSEPPSSYAVAEIAAAAPARSRGAVPRIVSPVTVRVRPAPAPNATWAASTSVYGVSAPTEPNRPNPSAARARPPDTVGARPNRRTNLAASTPPATSAASAPGTNARPERSGLQPSTSWKYWLLISANADIVNTDTRFEPTDAENPRRRNSSTSISGTSSRRWRRRNTTRQPPPTANAPSTSGYHSPA